MAATLSCLILLAGLVAVYPSLDAALRFLFYVLVFNLLPGLVVCRLLLPGLKELGSFVVYALSVGIAVNLLVFVPLWMAGAPQWLMVLPFAAAAAFIVLRRQLGFGALIAGARRGRRELCWAAAAALVTVTPLLTMQFFRAGVGPNFSFHFGFEALVVQDLARGWPPPNLMLADVPLSYNYAAHLWILAAQETCGVAVEILAGRFGPVFLLGCAAAQMMVFGRYVMRLNWAVAPMPVVGVFWIVGVPAIAGKIFATFTAFAAVLLMSTSLGFLLFFVIATIICDDRQRQPRPIGWTAAILVLLAFLLTGARVVGSPVLLCAIALLWAVDIGRYRRIPWRATIHLLACGAGFAAGLFFFFTIGQAFSGLGFASFTGEPFSALTDPVRETLFVLPAQLMAWHVPRLPAGMLAFLVMVLFQPGFLLPTLVCELRHMARHGASPAQTLLLGASIAGIAAVFLTYAPGHSQFTFLQYSNICLSILGAQGLQRILSRDGWLNAGRGARVLKAAALSSAGLLLILQFSQLPPSSLNWLGRRTEALTAYLQAPGDRIASIQSISSCVPDDDTDLLAIAASASADPVVLLLPARSDVPFPCDIWWTVLHPVQTIQAYAVDVIPGKASGALKERLDKRIELFHRLESASMDGRLSLPDLLMLADSFPPATPLYAIVDADLALGALPRLEIVARGTHRMLIRPKP